MCERTEEKAAFTHRKCLPSHVLLPKLIALNQCEAAGRIVWSVEIQAFCLNARLRAYLHGAQRAGEQATSHICRWGARPEEGNLPEPSDDY